ncbi:cytochrome o ubiquinol oxidase subunit 3 domain protein, partial [Vibrio parahaemolyticus V-223/04]
YAN